MKVNIHLNVSVRYFTKENPQKLIIIIKRILLENTDFKLHKVKKKSRNLMMEKRI